MNPNFYCEKDTAAGGATRCAEQCGSCGSTVGQAALAGAVSGLVHDGRCAAWKGFPCNCASAAFVSFRRANE